MLSHPELWQRIEKYNINSADSRFTFSDRLKRENGWTDQFTARVIDEYKAFLYLACVANHEVTPSEEVDQVWHLHLVYSHSYWSDLCGDVLRRQLHHGPTKGGKVENDRYAENYAATLASYEREFECKPPRDIWPDGKTRFKNPERLKFVDTDRHWVIPKPSDFLPLKLLTIVAGFSLVPAYFSSGPSDLSFGSRLSIWLFWMAFGLFVAALALFLRWMLTPYWKQKDANEKPRKSQNGSGCSSYVPGASGAGCSGAGDGGGGGCGGGGS
jgi:uncharacterized membrane protein YgcG